MDNSQDNQEQKESPQKKRLLKAKKLKEFWQNRKTLAEQRNAKTDSYSFLPGVLEVTDKPPHPLLKIILYCLIFLVMFVVVWAYFCKIDIIVNPTVLCTFMRSS